MDTRGITHQGVGQACGKCFKAVLVAAGIAAPRSHDLTGLIEISIGNGMAVPAAARWVAELTPCAAAPRYGTVAVGCWTGHAPC